jgi:hypothetical protein
MRRTGAVLGEIGQLFDIPAAPLAASYNRSRHRPQVTAAMQRLAEAPDRLR